MPKHNSLPKLMPRSSETMFLVLHPPPLVLDLERTPALFFTSPAPRPWACSRNFFLKGMCNLERTRGHCLFYRNCLCECFYGWPWKKIFVKNFLTLKFFLIFLIFFVDLEIVWPWTFFLIFVKVMSHYLDPHLASTMDGWSGGVSWSII